MKKITMYLGAAAVCFFLALDSTPLMAQDASHNTATANDDDNDSSDWGLLGLLGLVGLLGLRKREPVIEVNPERRTATGSTTSGVR
jgi:MYXO-CTERM domain-containing protein